MAIAILAERGELPINVKFLLEGEEESGGESIEKYVRSSAAERIDCDAVVVSDSSMYAPGQPSLLYGLKGLAYMEIRVDGPNRDLHSGTFGGAVANPANALAHILSKLLDSETGEVTIPGFYDDVVPLEDWERDAFGALIRVGLSHNYDEVCCLTARNVCLGSVDPIAIAILGRSRGNALQVGAYTWLRHGNRAD